MSIITDHIYKSSKRLTSKCKVYMLFNSEYVPLRKTDFVEVVKTLLEIIMVDFRVWSFCMYIVIKMSHIKCG